MVLLGTKRLLKTQFFGKEGKLSSEEKFLAYFFSCFLSLKNLGGQKIRVQRVFRHLMWKLSDLFFGPEGWIETKILKNICFHGDKRFWHVFRRIIE